MDKKNRLLMRPKEKHTNIQFAKMVFFDSLPGLLELRYSKGKWSNGLVFLKEDVPRRLRQSDLLRMVQTEMHIAQDSQATYKVDGDYVYVDFPFWMPEPTRR